VVITGASPENGGVLDDRRALAVAAVRPEERPPQLPPPASSQPLSLSQSCDDAIDGTTWKDVCHCVDIVLCTLSRLSACTFTHIVQCTVSSVTSVHYDECTQYINCLLHVVIYTQEHTIYYMHTCI